MTVVCAMPGNAPPPPWLALILGGAMIGYCVYETGKVRRDNERVGGDLFRTFLIFLVGMVIVAYGITLSLRG